MIKLPGPVALCTWGGRIEHLNEGSPSKLVGSKLITEAQLKQFGRDLLEQAAQECLKRASVLHEHMPKGIAADYFTRGAESGSKRNAAAIRALIKEIEE